MRIVYDLREDGAKIGAMQRASRDPGPVGLRATHGLIGSMEWWAHVEEGRLPVHSVCGVVSGFWPGQWGGGPAEFEMRAAGGRTWKWLCELEPRLAQSEFRVGRAVEVRFVIQELKTAFTGSTESRVTVGILLGE